MVEWLFFSLKHIIFIFIFILNLFELATETQKTIYESTNDKVNKQIEKETSASKETTSWISYWKLVSKRRRTAYPNTYDNPIK